MSGLDGAEQQSDRPVEHSTKDCGRTQNKLQLEAREAAVTAPFWCSPFWQRGRLEPARSGLLPRSIRGEETSTKGNRVLVIVETRAEHAYLVGTLLLESSSNNKVSANEILLPEQAKPL